MNGAFADERAGLSNAELEARITELAGHLNAANRRWLALIAEFDRRKGWHDGLTQSCAHWLNWKCGIDMGAAREKVRVAHALEQLPAIGAAMGRGELSYSKVRALTRVACPATERLLLTIALHGTAHHVETVVRQFRRVQEAAELSREARQHSGRRLTYSYDDDGSLVLKARLPAETGAIVLGALEAAMRDLPMPRILMRRVWTFPRKPADRRTPRRCARPRGRELPQAWAGGAERGRAPPHRGARGCGDAAGAGQRPLRARRRPGDSSRDRAPPVVRRERREDRRRRRRRAARRRSQDAHHPACAASCVEITRPGLRVPRLYAQALRRRSPHPALGRGRRDEAVESRFAVPRTSSCGARGRHRHPASRRRRLAIREAQWRGAACLRARLHPASGRLDAARRDPHRARHSRRCTHSRDSLARRDAWITVSPSIC